MTTLAEAKDRLREELVAGEVTTCPCCERLAKIYRNKIDSAMARTLILMVRDGRDDYMHVPSELPGDNHKVSQLSWWGLVEELDARREDGGKAGWWRVTDLGYDFATRRTTVQKYVNIYDSRVLSREGEMVTVVDCLNDKFDFNTLMYG